MIPKHRGRGAILMGYYPKSKYKDSAIESIQFWELGTGNWELGTGNWELGTGD
jgi:hypothetical protein